MDARSPVTRAVSLARALARHVLLHLRGDGPRILAGMLLGLWAVIVLVTFGMHIKGGVGVLTVAAVLGGIVLVVRKRSAVGAQLDRFAGARPWPLVVVVAIALSLRLIAVAMADPAMVSDFATYLELAQNLSDEGTFGFAQVPSNYRPVGWPAVLSLVYAIAPDPVVAAGVLNATLGSSTAAILYAWGERAAGPRVALVAAGCWAALPTSVFFTPTLATEPLFTFLLTGALYLWERGTGRQWRWIVGAAVTLGLAAYVRPQALAVIPAIAAVTAMRGVRGEGAVGLRRAAIAASLAIACTVPWGIRNAVQMGEFSLTSSNGGVTLYASNHPGATGYYRDPKTWEDPSAPEEELGRNRHYRDLAMAWIIDNPGTFMSLIPNKLTMLLRSQGYSTRYSFAGSEHDRVRVAGRLASQIAYLGMVLWALAALLVIRPGPLPRALLTVVASWALWFGLHAIFQGQGRYVLPLLPGLCLFGAYCLRPEA